MASLALVTQSTTHAAYTATLNALTGLGHSVTGFNMSAVTASNLAGFEAIVCARVQSTDASHATLAGHLAAYFAAGKPILIGFDGIVATADDRNGMATLLKLIGSESIATGRGPVYRASAAHPLWATASITPPADYSPIPMGTFAGRVNTTPAFAGSVIEQVSSSDNTPTIIVAEKGALNTDGNPFAARIAYIGWLYGATDYTAAGKAVLGGLISWALAPPWYISGTVKDSTTSPLARVVRAYNRASGMIMGSTISDAVTGAFQIEVPAMAADYYVVALDEAGGTQNAQIYDRIVSSS